MGHFYFIRHGQTVWNVANKICGATDIELTEKGHQQAIETGQEILRQGIHADEILYSPLMRAADTAKHISEIVGIPARVEPRLIEQNFGKYESTPRNGEEFQKAKQQFVTRYDGGESMLHLAQRIYNLLDEIREELQALYAAIRKTPPSAPLFSGWTHALISSGDRIFPTGNQFAFWQGRCPVAEIEAPHYPFYLWKQWNEIWNR